MWPIRQNERGADKMIKAAIAEDDFRVASIHEQFLEKIEGVEIAGKALNANDAIKLLESTEVDVLLLDNYLPDQNGVSLLTDLRKRQAGNPGRCSGGRAGSRCDSPTDSPWRG